jgi:hypothetical protein
MSYLSRLYYKIKYNNWKRSARYFYQRVTRGWDDSDLWSLDHTMAKFILPRLKRFAKCTGGHPHDMTSEEWENIIADMIFGVEWYASGDCWSCFDKDKSIRAQNGMELFGKYYGHLWS